MRRVLPVFLFFLILAYPLLAQRGGHSGGGMRGGGSVGMHGGGSFGGHGGGFVSGNRFSGGFSGFRGGFNRGPGFHTGFGFHRFRNSFLYPAFYGGYGFYDPFFWDSNYGYSNPYPYVGNAANYGYSAGQSPVVIVNEPYQYAAPEPAAPVIREYVAPAPPPTSSEEPLYLIAFKDGNIKAVAAYWVQGTVLHYVTMEHEQKQTAMASIDRELSNRLNRERNVSFLLP